MGQLTDAWMLWLYFGAALILLEFILPGGVVVFLGLAAVIVAGGVWIGWIPSVLTSFVIWFISSILLLLFLRSLFIGFFEGDSSVQNVDEDEDYVSSIVQVVDDVLPYKEGRVAFRGTTWQARSEEELIKGSSAVITGREGNVWIIKSIKETSC